MKRYNISLDVISKKYHKEGKSQQEIANELNVSQWVVSNRMRQAELKIFSKTRKLNPQKYTIDHNAFNKINRKTAWLIGWMVSDGFIRDSKRFGLKVSLVDIDIVDKFSNYLQYTGPFYRHKQTLKETNKIYNQVSIQPTSPKIVNELKKFGIVPNKSLNINFPEMIINRGEIIMRSFIRGVFEGDGSLLLDRRNSVLFQIVGTYQLCEGIQQQLIKFLSVKKTKLTLNIKGKNHFALRYRGRRQATKIMDWLYYNAGNDVLNRKYNQYLFIKGMSV